MLVITHYRNKCIGCNACVEIAPGQWKMSRKDGKSVLLGAQKKKMAHTGYFNDSVFDENLKAAEACPVNIIKVSFK